MNNLEFILLFEVHIRLCCVLLRIDLVIHNWGLLQHSYYVWPTSSLVRSHIAHVTIFFFIFSLFSSGFIVVATAQRLLIGSRWNCLTMLSLCFSCERPVLVTLELFFSMTNFLPSILERPLITPVPNVNTMVLLGYHSENPILGLIVW